jgi:endoglucanase
LRLRRTLTRALPGLALAAATVLGGPFAHPAAAATPACQVAYSVVNQWPTGFQASVDVTNNAAALTNWALAFQFANGQQVSNGWNGIWTQASGSPQVTVTNASWNGNLGTGQTMNMGVVGTLGGPTNAVPDYFTLNGVACNGALQRPTVSLTSPAPNAIFDSAASVTLSATAASTSGGTITKVEFDDGATALGTVTASPFTVSATVASGVHVITARAFDSNGATATTIAALIFVNKPGQSGAPALHVSANKLLDAAGRTVVLHGANRSGAEFMCVHGFGFFDGPADAQSIIWIASWNINAVRIPLNEDCWLGLSNVMPQFAGANYRTAIVNYVNLLHQYGIVAILDLHWSDGVYTGQSTQCSTATADCQKPMVDSTNGVPFWTSVANTFKGDPATVLDLFNEPFPERAVGSENQGWLCWRDGGSACSPGISYPVAGMQTLVDTVRATGARNVVLLGGLAFSNDETQWLQFEPTDPAGNLVASWHSYNFNACITTACWSSQIAPVAARVPLVAGEIGENDCAHGYIDGLMPFLDQQGAGYLGWTWNSDFDCARGPGLITAYDGTPTAFGIGLRDHLRALP